MAGLVPAIMGKPMLPMVPPICGMPAYMPALPMVPVLVMKGCCWKLPPYIGTWPMLWPIGIIMGTWLNCPVYCIMFGIVVPKYCPPTCGICPAPIEPVNVPVPVCGAYGCPTPGWPVAGCCCVGCAGCCVGAVVGATGAGSTGASFVGEPPGLGDPAACWFFSLSASSSSGVIMPSKSFAMASCPQRLAISKGVPLLPATSALAPFAITCLITLMKPALVARCRQVSPYLLVMFGSAWFQRRRETLLSLPRKAAMWSGVSP
mmetsp:Transcript_16285/g.63485  ORF Transcript_16285/g.63485 Transcript_16285/m.63485 type:complete len:261 (+) Transcript_16285:938-1720(+)